MILKGFLFIAPVVLAMASGEVLASDCVPGTGNLVKRPVSDFRFTDGIRNSFNWIDPNTNPVRELLIARTYPALAPVTIPVTGSITEKTLCDGTARIHAVLHYENAPLTVVTLTAPPFALLDVIAVNGSYEQNAEFIFDIEAPGAPLLVNTRTFKLLKASGRGSAFATGFGPFGFTAGNEIDAKTTQVGLQLSPAAPNSAVGLDGFPTEKIHLREIR